MTIEAARSQWAERIQAQRASGKSKTVFCREHGIKPKTFYRWARILGGRGTAVTAKPPPRFARVEVVRPVETRTVTVRLPGGVAIESREYPDPMWLKALVSDLVREGIR